jgi:hypothetical protein
MNVLPGYFKFLTQDNVLRTLLRNHTAWVAISNALTRDILNCSRRWRALQSQRGILGSELLLSGTDEVGGIVVALQAFITLKPLFSLQGLSNHRILS